VFYFGDGAFEVKCLGEDDLEDLHDCKHGLVRDKNREHTFCTLILWLVLLKMRLAFMAFANRFAYGILVVGSEVLYLEAVYLIGDLFLLFPGEVDEVIVLCAN
jgi:hypothetical protein